jgi:hypothetical protein
MNISFEKTIGYLLDLADIPRGELPERAINNYRSLAYAASCERINGYIVSWILDNWNQYLDDRLRFKLLNTAFSITHGNTQIIDHILHLSSVFHIDSIPALFLKGAAGYMRDVYPLEARSASDIDVLIPEDTIPAATHCLQRNGYGIDLSTEIPSCHHHVHPFKHPDFTGTVEIHYEPYDFSMLDRPAIPDIWDNAEIVIKKGIEVRVPSITDHVWIFMRSHAYNNVYIPNFHNTLEFLSLIESGHAICYDTLQSRSTRDMIPMMMNEVYHTSEKYFGIRLNCDFSADITERWESWSYGNKKRELFTKKSNTPHKRFGCIFFLNNGNALHKLILLKKIVKYETREDMEKSPSFCKFFFFWAIYRYLKDSFLLLLNYMSYYARARVKKRRAAVEMDNTRPASENLPGYHVERRRSAKRS